KVCYKRSTHRKRARPSLCGEGFRWDQVATCLREGSSNGAHCLPPCGGQAGMCETFCGKGGACCKSGDPRDPAECEGATGFLDFGGSDYHQCVRPGPNLAFTVEGAGVRAVNGLYVHSGEHSGRPRYLKARSPKTVMEWSESRKAWRFFVDDTWFGVGRATLYRSSADTATFRGLLKVPVEVPSWFRALWQLEVRAGVRGRLPRGGHGRVRRQPGRAGDRHDRDGRHGCQRRHPSRTCSSTR
ncbi:unnamed protein product, partial [Prorocentrum cordatum]